MNLLHLSEQVIKVKAFFLHLVSKLLSLFLVKGLLSLLNKGEHISHSKYTGSHSFRVEGLKLVKLFSHTNELNRLTCYCQHGQCRTAAGIRIKLGKYNRVDSKCLIKRRGYLYSVLTDHSIDNEHYLVRLCDLLDVLELVHKLLINVQTSCRIYDNKVVTVILSVLKTLFYNLSRVDLTHFKDGYLGSLSDNFQLVNSRRSVNVGSYQQRSLSVLFEHLCKLSRMGSLT